MFRRLMFSMVLLASLTGPAPAQDLSTFTEQLVKLFDVFGKLDAAAAAQMDANERSLLAKKMMGLSEAFRQLSVAKSRYENQIKRAFEANRPKTREMAEAANNLAHMVQCLSTRLEDTIAAPLAAQIGLKGNEVEAGLRKGLDEKYSTLNDQMVRLGFGNDAVDIDATLLIDSQKAHETAEALQKSAATFAKLLDPNVLPQSAAFACTAH